MIVYSPSVEHPHAPLKVVLMSGLSDPTCCALSPVQRRFLDALNLPAESRIDANFPYLPGVRNEQRPISLWIASWNNWNQFRSAARVPYRDHARRHWQALVKSCDRLLVITLSCGLEILNVCLASGEIPAQIDVLALGPVAWKRPPVSHLLVRGSRDRVLNPAFREVDQVLPGLGHLDYFQSPTVLELARHRLERLGADARRS